MVPSVPADSAEGDGTLSKNVAAESPSSVTLIPDAKPVSTLSSLQETWEDIREAVTETDLYVSTSEKVTVITSAASAVWSFSKKVAWVVGTSALVLVVPLLYEIDKELGPGFDPAVQNESSPPGGETATSVADSANTTTSSPDVPKSS